MRIEESEEEIKVRDKNKWKRKRKTKERGVTCLVVLLVWSAKLSVFSHSRPREKKG